MQQKTTRRRAWLALGASLSALVISAGGAATAQAADAPLLTGNVSPVTPGFLIDASADGRTLLTADAGPFTYFDRASGTSAPVASVAWSSQPRLLPDGSGLFGADQSGQVVIADRATSSSRVLLASTGGTFWYPLAVNEQRTVVAAGGSNPATGTPSLVLADFTTGAVQPVPVDPATVGMFSQATSASFSADGRRIAYTWNSGPTGCTLDCSRVWVFDRQTGLSTSIDRARPGVASLGGVAESAVISADGSTVVFRSNEPGLDADVPPTSGFGIYAHDLATGTIRRVSPSGESPAVSGDGQRVVYVDASTGMPQAWLADHRFGRGDALQLVSEHNGTAARAGVSQARLTVDGNEVIFGSASDDLGVPSSSMAIYSRSVVDGGFTSVAPQRLLDTRAGASTIDGQAQGGGRVPAGSTTRLQVGGRAGIPQDASGAVLNVTVTDPTGAGYITVWPCGEVPNASNLNFVAGQTVANLAIGSLGPDGAVCILNAEADTHIIVDAGGYYPASTSLFPMAPQRLLDTRTGGATVDGVAQAGGIRPAGETLELQVVGRAGVPAQASAALLNITTTAPTGPGYVTAWPCGEVPNASVGNFAAAQTVANFVVVPLSADGRVCLRVSESDAHLIADVSGYFVGSFGYAPLTPQRIVDTRGNGTTVDGTAQGGGAVPAGQTLQFDVRGRAGIPASAVEVALTVTVTGATGPGYLTMWDCNGDAPNASILNYGAQQNVANLVVVPVSSAGTVCVQPGVSATHVLVDVSGYTR